jgi:hypothetical protein
MPALLTRMSTLPYLGLVGAVHGDGEGVAALALDLPGRRVGRVEVQVGDHRDGAFGRQPDRDLLADAAGRAGDDGHSSFEIGHETIL